MTFGKPLLLPLMGPELFSKFSVAAKYLHDYLSFPFVLGLVLIFVLWVRDNVPGRIDVVWLKKFGGFVGHDHPPAPRFNAGQKAVFWVVILTGAAVAVSGYYLIFPFYAAGIAGMQTAEIVHGVLAVLFVAAMLAHIYIGTIGMEGAFDAMGSGQVDLNWAKEHHSLWVEEEQGRAAATPAHATPAE
jgi:formate dehydrogenase subunit gamma